MPPTKSTTPPRLPTTPLTRLHHPSNTPIHAVTFSACTGAYVLTGAADRAIRLFNGSTGRAIQTYTGAHNAGILDVAVAADNARFASAAGGRDRAVVLWDVVAGTTVRRFAGHAAAVNAVAFGAEGDGVLVSGSLDGTVKVWDLRAQGANRAVVTLGEARDGVSSVAVLGREIYAGSVDGRVRVYDVGMGEVDCDVVAPGDGVTSVVPTRAGDAYLVGSLGSVVRLMDRGSGKCLQTFRDGEAFRSEEYRVRSTLAVGDGIALSGSEGGRVVAWDVLSGEVVARLWHAAEHGGGRDAEGGKVNKQEVVSAVAWNPLRKQWASAGGDGTVVVWGDAGDV